MNWYNKLIKICQNVLDKKPNYLEVGHGINENYPNYVWYFINGVIKVEKQTEEMRGHQDMLEYGLYGGAGNLYSGRFESKTGNLSIHKPPQGVNAFRDVPSRLISQLYQKFPNIIQIHTY